MATERKIETVKELRDRIERCAIAIAADYRGLSVTQMVELRRAVREAGVEMRVVKNRLFLRAAAEAGKPELAELMDGPTAVLFGFDDVVAPARVANEYARSSRSTFALRLGVMDGRTLSKADLEDLAELPPREVLVARLAGALQAPVANLAGLFRNILSVPPGRLLNDSVSTFAGLLEARAKQLEGA